MQPGEEEAMLFALNCCAANLTSERESLRISIGLSAE
jgi:hypothetical protein